jgi:hypothetical protein
MRPLPSHAPRATAPAALGVLLAVALAVLAVATSAAAAPLSPVRASAYVNFRTPSGNIGCGDSTFANETPSLRCEVASHLKPLPQQTEKCREGIWGRAVSMSPRGRATPHCISDTVLEPTAPVLAYGRTWRRGSFTCRSEETGLTCRNAAGHGWRLSRARSTLF